MNKKLTLEDMLLICTLKSVDSRLQEVLTYKQDDSPYTAHVDHIRYEIAHLLDEIEGNGKDK